MGERLRKAKRPKGSDPKLGFQGVDPCYGEAPKRKESGLGGCIRVPLGSSLGELRALWRLFSLEKV